MPFDTQVQMRYPAPDRHARKVRGPVQVIDGVLEERRLYIRSTRVMSHEIAREFKARGVAHQILRTEAAE